MVESQGMLGVAAQRESKTQGGERRAEDVTAHTAMAARSTLALAPEYGSTKKATLESTQPASIQPPKRPRAARTRSTQKPVTTSIAAKTSWSATRIHGTHSRPMPAPCAS